MATRSDFIAWRVDGRDAIAVVDLSSERTSVTNDAENVLVHVRPLVLGPDTRVVYRDTEGVWDELEHSDGAFVGFRHLGASTLDEAVQ